MQRLTAIDSTVDESLFCVVEMSLKLNRSKSSQLVGRSYLNDANVLEQADHTLLICQCQSVRLPLVM